MNFEEWDCHTDMFKEVDPKRILADWKAEREKLIGVLGKIKRDIFEPDKITIHIERILAEMKEQG